MPKSHIFIEQLFYAHLDYQSCISKHSIKNCCFRFWVFNG